MGWVSDFLRKAILKIDSINGIEHPLDNRLTGGSNRMGWHKIFSNIAWDFSVTLSDTTVTPPNPNKDGWSDAELHADMLQLDFLVVPTFSEVPLWARPSVPENIGLRAGYPGIVTQSSGVSRSFRSIFIIDSSAFKLLAPGDVITGSATLLRGAEGALFPSSGLFDVKVQIQWDRQGAVASIVSSTSVLVTGPNTTSRAAAAHQLLASPDAHLVLVLGGDHLEQGVNARRLATRFGSRAPDIEAAKQLITSDYVLTSSEKQELRMLLP